MSTSDRRSERPNDEREVADLEFDFHSEDVLDKPFDQGLARRLLRYVLPYRGLLLL